MNPWCWLTTLFLAAPLSAQATPEAIAQAVDSLAARVVATGVSPALGVVVVKDGRSIFERAYGVADASRAIPAGPGTLWYLASTSKSYTGFGISLLVAQGRLDLATPITHLLPGVEWPAGVDPDGLTLARFLSHTHHINDNAVVASAAFTGAIAERDWPALIRYATASGNRDLVYSNFGYNVAAMVMDRLEPDGWRSYLERAVYRPAGMHETYARVSGLDPARIARPHSFAPDGGFVTRPFEKTDATMNSAGGHLATLHDLGRWMIVQMDSGRIDGTQVFPAAAVVAGQRLLARQTVPGRRQFAYFEREGWGTGWDLGSYRGEPMVSRFGGYSTLRSHLSMLPGRRVGVAAQVNGPGASLATDVIAALVYDLDAGRPDAEAVAWARLDTLVAQLGPARERAAVIEADRRDRQRPLRYPLERFAGAYGNPAFGTVRFAVDGDRLRYSWGVLSGPVQVFDAGQDRLLIEFAGSGYPVSFFFEDSGPATAIQVMGERFGRIQ